MSAALQTPATVTVSESVCTLLRSLGAGKDGFLLVSARSRHGYGDQTVALSGPFSKSWVPGALLALLEEDWAASVALPVLDERHRASRPLRLGALVATVDVPHVYRNPDHPPEYEYGRRWIPDEPALAAAAERCRSFLAPTLLLDARTSLAALWALRTPLDVWGDEAPALELLRHVAAAVGATVPAQDARLADLVVPVPGSAVRVAPYVDFVTAVSLAERAFSVDDVKAVLAAARKE